MDNEEYDSIIRESASRVWIDWAREYNTPVSTGSLLTGTPRLRSSLIEPKSFTASEIEAREAEGMTSRLAEEMAARLPARRAEKSLLSAAVLEPLIRGLEPNLVARDEVDAPAGRELTLDEELGIEEESPAQLWGSWS
mgnify:CR=1 FL=1|tara:strand:+ start:562 stop:975 length:414 start_codon:yes stop_codon:yes gene_type:complete